MVDMLVKLHDLSEASVELPEGISVRRAFAAEKHVVTRWVADHFAPGWADECEVSFYRRPISCFIAAMQDRPVGFCVYDSTALGMAGPIGLAPTYRNQGIGRVLLLAALADMRAKGYAYAVIGWVDSTTVYSKICGAVVIEGSEPGFYSGLLRDGGRIGT
jgi:GNAT superfamily N-acetyltransferase